MRVLILGGTGEGLALAALLSERPEFAVTSSLAGRVADPRLPPGAVRIGGFGGIEGLATYLRDERIEAVIDATHPFAATISAHAAQACTQAGVPLLALVRPDWQAEAGDNWLHAASVAEAAERIESLGRRIFLTLGRQELAPFAQCREAWFLIRAIERPSAPLPPRHELILARGPFAEAEEEALIRRYGIEVLVSKMSGGPATSAKLAAARRLGLPVMMIDRPPRPLTEQAASPEAAFDWLRKLAEAGRS